MGYLVFSCSLNPESRSRALARRLLQRLEQQAVPAAFIDLRDYQLPFCDGANCYGNPAVQELTQRIAAARGIVVAATIYNYDVNAAAKNLLELTGRAWTGKVVGFICAAGRQGSYMSPMPFANSLMLDFRCHVVPRYVYSVEADPGDVLFGDAAIENRLAELADDVIHLTEALQPRAR